MPRRITPWFNRPLVWLRSGKAIGRGRAGRVIPAFEAMETRLVLSGFPGEHGINLLSTLASVGVVTGPVEAVPSNAPTSTNSRIAQFQADLKKLQTDLQALAAKSSVSVADLNAVANDSEAIVEAGAYLDRDALKTVISELAAAVASNSDTSQAKSDFKALFTGTSVSTTVIDQTFADIVKLIQDSGVTADDLKLISGDTAAIQADTGGSGRGDGFGPPSAVFDGGFGHDRGTLLAGLNGLGVVTNTGFGPLGGPKGPGPGHEPDFNWGSSSTTGSQFQIDIEKLQTDLEGLAGKSTVTVAELNALAQDQQAIAAAGVHLDPAALNAALGAIANAVVAGSDTAQAKAEFTALFSNSTIPSTTLDRMFADITRVILASKVTAPDLLLISTDQANIRNDLANLGQAPSNSTNADGTPCAAGSGSSGGTTSATTSTTTSTSTAASTTSTKATTTSVKAGAHPKGKLAAAHRASAARRRAAKA